MARDAGNCVEVDLFDANDNLVTGYIYGDSPAYVWIESPNGKRETQVAISQVGPWNSPYHRYHWM